VAEDIECKDYSQIQNLTTNTTYQLPSQLVRLVANKNLVGFFYLYFHLRKSGGWKWYLEVTNINKLPAFEASPDSQIHVLYRCSSLPPSSFIDCWYSPHTSSTCTQFPYLYQSVLDIYGTLRKKIRPIYCFVNMGFTIESKESIGSRPHFLFHSEMVIQWHLLHPCH